jgi:hypothetical protein
MAAVTPEPAIWCEDIGNAIGNYFAGRAAGTISGNQTRVPVNADIDGRFRTFPILFDGDDGCFAMSLGRC